MMILGIRKKGERHFTETTLRKGPTYGRGADPRRELYFELPWKIRKRIKEGEVVDIKLIYTVPAVSIPRVLHMFIMHSIRVDSIYIDGFIDEGNQWYTVCCSYIDGRLSCWDTQLLVRKKKWTII